MLRILFPLAFLAGVLISIFLTVKIRSAGLKDPAMPDVLTRGERIWAIITIFLGGGIVAGSIYYYGLKGRFPKKAKSVLHVEWVFLLFVLIEIGSIWYWTTNVIVPAQMKLGIEQAQVLSDQYKLQQAQQLQQQQSSLTSGTSETYQGTGFSIDVPAGWIEDTFGAGQWVSYGQAKVWHTNDGKRELDVVWNTDMPDSKLSQAEGFALSGATGFPDKYALAHPSIPGASKTQLTYDTKVYADGPYTIQLFVHGNGKIYFINATLANGTDAEAAALKDILLSFKLSN